MYVIDSCSTIRLFRYFHPDVHVSLWAEFHGAFETGVLLSVDECRKELIRKDDTAGAWATSAASQFIVPTSDETDFVEEVLGVPQFSGNLPMNVILAGEPYADPFLVARSKYESRKIITEERFAPNSAKIPTICRHFGLKEPVTLDEWMIEMGFKF